TGPSSIALAMGSGVSPMNEVAFNHACVNLAEPSILTLDLAANLGFYFRPKSVMAAVYTASSK
ncbi:hypothetical protein, partial [Klebsiella aerogenes]|uniref:hypothetical protein n=1 Tax=Klebsiella aerogenes TaxID=548 RepID=UPI0019541CAC